MSMTISDSNYMREMLQNTRLSGSDKQERKDSEGEAGKVQQTTTSAELDQVNLGEDGITVAQVSRTQAAAQSTAQKQSAAPRMDTVEISEEGKAASAKLEAGETGTTSVQEYEAETEDLSEYTNSELKQMYYKGEITRQEYEKETGELLE